MTDRPAGGQIDWLASYPKSGNTWMRLLLAAYFSEREDRHDINAPGVTNGIISARSILDNVTGIDSADLTDAETASLVPGMCRTLAANAAKRLWLKVHDARFRLSDGRWHLPPEVSGIAVYLLRDPRDVAVSNAFHSGQDLQRAVDRLCDPDATIGGSSGAQLRQRLGSWRQHVESWIDQRDIPTLVVRYEDMLDDAGRELANVLAFARPEISIDPERIAGAVAKTMFERLQNAESRSGFRERSPKQARFFRSGRAGDWRNHLTTAQAERIRAYNGATMARFGYG
jgi:aryl sulfotransferase